ncbi:MAG: alpha-amylase family glycosyl hydrolase, partial [Chloroflexota bacterium]
PDVRAAMHDVLRFWMDRGVDGFRMDVVHMIWKHPDMPDQPFIDGADVRGEGDIFNRQEQIYALNYEGIDSIHGEMRAVLDENNAISVGEIWVSSEERMAYYENFQMPFNFDFIMEGQRRTWGADFFRDHVNAMEAMLPEGAWPNYVLGNHDVDRLASRYGSQARARVAAMLLLTLRGTPTLYAGDEIGMVNGEITEADVQDPQGINLGVEHSRDVCRTPMQWGDSAYAGFSQSETWLPVTSDYPTRNVATMGDEPTSILSLYRRLLWYRKDHLSIAVGDYAPIDTPENVYGFTRTHGDERHLVLLNFGGDAQAVALPGDGEIVISTGLDRDGAISGSVELGGDEGLLIQLS